jgi:TolB-like protein/tetratricopeptide (TPR) repeat protein
MTNPRRTAGSHERRETADDRLEGWKAIATYLARDVRTVNRWEADEGLPIHRHVHRKRGSVYAYQSELDTWRGGRQARVPVLPTRKTMLAVLPFANLGDDAEQEYFSDGVTEEVIAQLGRVHPGSLGVIARTSVMRYKKTLRGVDRIGRELGVDYILEGSVRRAGGRVRVTAQLIYVGDQSHVWADSYERDLGDMLLVQSDIARAIAREIHITVTPEGARRLARARQVNPEAHEAYLKGRFHHQKLSRHHLDIALDYFQRALEKEPGYALAHAGVAYVWFSRGDCGLMAPDDAFPQAKAAALRALELDDSLAEVHELLGNMRRHYDWDWNGAENAFREAIRIDPNYATSHFMYADFLVSMERPEDGAAEIARALQLDPFNFLFRCFQGWHSIYLGRYDDAIVQLRETLKTEPAYPAAHLGLWGAFYKKRIYAEALVAARTFFELLGDEELVGIFDQRGGDREYAGVMREAADALVRRVGVAHVPALRIARLYAHAGEHERALDWLEQACDRRESPLVHVQVAWDWDDLRQDLRFQDLLGRMRLAEYTPRALSTS